ncbi:unnamed protein product, partial [Ilex paraguariensis]
MAAAPLFWQHPLEEVITKTTDVNIVDNNQKHQSKLSDAQVKLDITKAVVPAPTTTPSTKSKFSSILASLK